MSNKQFHLERKHNVELKSDIINNIDIQSLKRKITVPNESNYAAMEFVLHSTPSVVSAASTSSDVEGPTKNKQFRIDTTQFKQNGGSRAAEITNKILFMLTKDNMAFEAIEKEGFKLFIKSVAPLYKLPSRETIINLMEEKYKALSTIIKAELSSVEYLSLTTDIWEDRLNFRLYFGVTSHYIFNNQHKSVTIGVTELTERQSAKYFETWLLDVTNEWKIRKENIVVVVSNAGSHIQKAIKDAFGNDKYLACFGNSLNLIPSKVIELPVIKSISNKIRTIFTYFKRSTTAADKLKTSIDLKLIQYFSSQWISTYNMLQMFIDLSDVIKEILLQCRTAPTMITASELETVKESVNLLKPFLDAIKTISAEPYLMASKAIPVVNTLKTSLNALQPKTEIGSKMKKLLLEQFREGFNFIENEIILSISTVLDPRFKNIHFKNDLAYFKTIGNISRALYTRELHKRPIQNNSTSTNIKNDFWSYHRELVNTIKIQDTVHSNDNEMQVDLRYYLVQPPIDINSCPIQFWNSDNTVLGKLGRKYLSAVATSFPGERIFSKPGRIILESRCRLSTQHLRQLFFLESLSSEDWQL
ncbi:E3 SUMO-protein ligase ZBED1-like isoform X2 [Prorops nasuta]|uniref:E3 SUMO-protein ligase ZBED1-like isoform X2 n=1 Tax=Prorops nasuta TaxID=863751 RepID=UPI0034CD15ED